MLAPNTIHRIDCIDGMQELEAGCVDLAFADPPFNIGYDYDVYDDKKESSAYLDWSRKWISGVHRVLKPNGTFWLAIGDDYAAELKLLAQDVGFHCRSWVIWYYTFGVNCKFKFSRSHTHLFHFVKDKKEFTFNREAILVPSARQLVYADKRAAAGRLPDDTWILRPQDLTDGFGPDESTWYFPRVAGTFKEREGFHGCQMPEQLLWRILKVSSNESELVLDPFSGSSTTVAVAKKRNRRFIGFEISPEYVTRGLQRLESIEPGDPIDGSEEPTASAPKTPSYTTKATSAVQMAKRKPAKSLFSSTESIATANGSKSPRTGAMAESIVEAFEKTSLGYSTDRVVADPELNASFLSACKRLGLAEDDVVLNKALFRLRKSGRIAAAVPTTERTEFTWSQTDPFLFASEIAWRMVSDESKLGLDDIICDPHWVRRFDEIASQFAPGFSSLQYRWGALKLRKEAKTADVRSRQLSDSFQLPKPNAVSSSFLHKVENVPGLYVVSSEKKEPLYVGESLNLAKSLSQQFTDGTPCKGWQGHGEAFLLTVVPHEKLNLESKGLSPDPLSRWLVACQLNLVRQIKPSLNRLGTESTAA